MKVSVKWNKQQFELEVDAAEGLDVLRAQLFALTNVPAERQKIMFKGKMLKSDDDVNALKDGAKLLLMGSAEALPEPPKDKVLFEEDLSNEEKTRIAKHASKQVGLRNIGNTCYMNSTLQCLRGVPQLRNALRPVALQRVSGFPTPQALTVHLAMLFNQLDSSSEAVVPTMFALLFRQLFPQFDEVNSHGVHMQQDADECLVQILNSASQHLKSGLPADAVERKMDNEIDYIFGGELECVLRNAENKDESPQVTHEIFRRLKCHINLDVNFLHDGLLQGLKEEIVKNSPTLGREAKYEKTSAISQLPSNLIVQFVRFYWRNDTKKKAKILRKVQFPLILDIAPYCAEGLKKRIEDRRGRRLDQENAKLGLAPLMAQDAKGNQETQARVESRDVDMVAGESKEGADPGDKGELNHMGYYELFAVITHQGRFADGGHYIAWVRQTGDDWLRYDDDVVTTVNSEEILRLCGGGDWHMAYICMYRLTLGDELPGRTNKQKKAKQEGQ